MIHLALADEVQTWPCTAELMSMGSVVVGPFPSRTAKLWSGYTSTYAISHATATTSPTGHPRLTLRMVWSDCVVAGMAHTGIAC